MRTAGDLRPALRPCRGVACYAPTFARGQPPLLAKRAKFRVPPFVVSVSNHAHTPWRFHAGVAKHCIMNNLNAAGKEAGFYTCGASRVTIVTKDNS